MMRLSIALTTLAAALLLAGGAAAQGDPATGQIQWSEDLTTAFARAKQTQVILMICVNAKQVDGSTRIEPAAKGLREIVYKDARVVAKSREFVCALLSPSSKSSEFGELRMLGIEGALISPQHVFIHPDGGRILLRKQYWSHGSGEGGVTALLEMMDEAKAKLAAPPEEAPEGDSLAPPTGAPTGDDRPAWIAERIREIIEGQRAARDRAIDQLIRNDKEGDCTTPLLALLAEQKKNAVLQVDVIRGLGRDQLTLAALPVSEFLSNKEEALRGIAAVSLEYIGSRDKAVVAALLRAAGKEKDDAIANHIYRALGRCGVEDNKVRALLLKKCESAKSEFASYGPAIALAYFEGDKKAARGVEDVLKKIGIPGGRRGGGENIIKRSVLSWTLASIGDPASATFMREELLAKLENVKAFWVDGLRAFYETVAKKCDGDATAMDGVENGVRGAVGFARGAGMGSNDTESRELLDEYRKDRPVGSFTPKGEYLLGPGGDT